MTATPMQLLAEWCDRHDWRLGLYVDPSPQTRPTTLDRTITRRLHLLEARHRVTARGESVQILPGSNVQEAARTLQRVLDCK